MKGLEWSMGQYEEEFKEIAHCGGQITINVKTEGNGNTAIQFGIKHSRPNPSGIFAIYALPDGHPVGTIQLGGVGTPWNPPPVRNCYPVFIASDSHGLYGHQCPNCNGYWRSRGAPSLWKVTCSYCGSRGDTHVFLTPGQLKYVRAYFELLDQAMASGGDGKYAIDMDEVADAAGKEGEKPKFYYAEETQQNNYICAACGDRNDIRGRYGYCSTCGTYNGFAELKNDINATRDRMRATEHYQSAIKDVVSAFDSYARHISQQFAARIPMTVRRADECNRKLFHNLKAVETLKTIFDIDVLKGLRQEDAEFCSLMFHRRHVYEHNGGQVDEKYLKDSGDRSVRLGQVIRENRENALRIADLVTKMGQSLHNGFHEIFPPEELPLEIHRQRRIDRRNLTQG